ncbi:glycosyltransferase family 2 protein [Leuconostoc carnosum]|uniref:glycosyltransferase family 2 protein n=1 Tax=Leuconostoc carnosum TaxID=1252 RepID=UPI001680008B|nr:glycosyltransferase family 2 protein [Leuconostoc carnosum]
MDKTISVIMPTHDIVKKRINGECAIESTIKSFLDQNIENKELIIVDDASTDDSVQYISRFIRQHDFQNKIKLISLDNHVGPGGARNTGLELARGKYIFFLDADDLIGKNSLSILVNKLELWNSDFVLGQYIALKRDYAKQFAKNGDVEDADIESNRLVSTLGPWGKLFKKSIIQDNNIEFTENILMFEDAAFLFKYLDHAVKKSISVNNIPHYILRNNDESTDNLTGRKVTLSDRLIGLESVLAGIRDSSNMLRALALDRLFIYPSQSDPFKNYWIDKKRQCWYFGEYKKILLKFQISSWLELIPSHSVRSTVQALIDGYDLTDIVNIGSFSEEYYGRWSYFHTNLNFSSYLQKILYIGEVKTSILSIDNIKFRIDNPYIITFTSNFELDRKSIIMMERDCESNFVEFEFNKNILEVDMHDVGLNYRKRIDIYIKYTYNNIVMSIMLPVNNKINSEKNRFYKNWRGGLTYKDCDI